MNHWNWMVDSMVAMMAMSVSVFALAEQLPLDLTSIIAVYGPMGGMLVWFMVRSEKQSTKLIESHDRLSRAIWASLLVRGDIDEHVRAEAQREINEIDRSRA